MQLGQSEQAWLANLGVYEAVKEDFEQDHGMKAEWVDITDVTDEVLTDGSALSRLEVTTIRARVKNGRVHDVLYRIHDHSFRPLVSQVQIEAVRDLGRR